MGDREFLRWGRLGCVILRIPDEHARSAGILTTSEEKVQHMAAQIIRQIPRPAPKPERAVTPRKSVESTKTEKTPKPRKPAAAPTLTAERLRELMHYDPETGIFTRKVSTAPNARAGDVAGTLMQIGYIAISADNKTHYAHRLAWLYVHGNWPKEQIDHINRDRADNRIANLREVTIKQNQRNLSKASNNTSGHPGVHWRSDRAKWWALIESEGQKHYLGCYNTIEEAIAARKAGELRYWGAHRSD